MKLSVDVLRTRAASLVWVQASTTLCIGLVHNHFFLGGGDCLVCMTTCVGYVDERSLQSNLRRSASSRHDSQSRLGRGEVPVAKGEMSGTGVAAGIPTRCCMARGWGSRWRQSSTSRECAGRRASCWPKSTCCLGISGPSTLTALWPKFSPVLWRCALPRALPRVLLPPSSALVPLGRHLASGGLPDTPPLPGIPFLGVSLHHRWPRPLLGRSASPREQFSEQPSYPRPVKHYWQPRQ